MLGMQVVIFLSGNLVFVEDENTIMEIQ